MDFKNINNPAMMLATIYRVRAATRAHQLANEQKGTGQRLTLPGWGRINSEASTETSERSPSGQEAGETEKNSQSQHVSQTDEHKASDVSTKTWSSTTSSEPSIEQTNSESRDSEGVIEGTAGPPSQTQTLADEDEIFTDEDSESFDSETDEEFERQLINLKTQMDELIREREQCKHSIPAPSEGPIFEKTVSSSSRKRNHEETLGPITFTEPSIELGTVPKDKCTNSDEKVAPTHSKDAEEAELQLRELKKAKSIQKDAAEGE